MRVRLLVQPIDPDAVRIRPAPRLLRLVWGRGIQAMTVRNTIFLDPSLIERAERRSGLLLVHELIHVRQWHELGVLRFLWRYLRAYIGGRLKRLGHRAAYLAIPLEVEARDAAALIT